MLITDHVDNKSVHNRPHSKVETAMFIADQFVEDQFITDQLIRDQVRSRSVHSEPRRPVHNRPRRNKHVQVAFHKWPHS